MLSRLSGLFVLLALLGFVQPASAEVSVGVNIQVGPPPMPVYAQPLIPGPGYMWTPGYWAYGPYGYYWVPGTWVMAPAVGLLWTPGYWGWYGGYYVWHRGYWGPHVGFYGGINYGYGYFGSGYRGGYWRHGAFYYNRSVNNMRGSTVTNTYTKSVASAGRMGHTSFNGGEGGTKAQPTSGQLAAANEQHMEPTSEQTQHEQLAGSNKTQWASQNNGRPKIAATPTPGRFTDPGVTHASGYRHGGHPNMNRNGARPPGNRAGAHRPPGRGGHGR